MRSAKHLLWIKGSGCCGLWSSSPHQAPPSSPPPEASSAAKSSSSSSRLWDAWTAFSASKSSGRGTSPHTLEAWLTCSKHREMYRGWSLLREKVTPSAIMDPGRVEGKPSWDRKQGLWCVYFDHLLSPRGLLKRSHANNPGMNPAHGLKLSYHTKTWSMCCCMYYYCIITIFWIWTVEADNRCSQLTAVTHV